MKMVDNISRCFQRVVSYNNKHLLQTVLKTYYTSCTSYYTLKKNYSIQYMFKIFTFQKLFQLHINFN